jgi:hypothetical protein
MRTAVLWSLLLLLSCGTENDGLDENGLAISGSAQSQFARASQLYWRGSLSASREEFNGVIYRFPGSTLAEDARLAVRRIENELRETEVPGDPAGAHGVFRGLSVTIVGRSNGRTVMEYISEKLSLRGSSVNLVYDSQAPEVTVVLYRHGHELQARALADSLSEWLFRPALVEHQGGGGLIDAVAPGSGGIMVVVGTDARLDN